MTTDNTEKKPPSCADHKRDVAGITDMKELAMAIGDLHYESLSELLSHLADKLHTDAKKDEQDGRNLLAHQLDDAAYAIAQSGDYILDAWLICKPYMNDLNPSDND